jgi:hypothetical protein
MGTCSLRVICGGGQRSVPFSDWKSYTVATDVQGTAAFTIRACIVDSEKGKLLSWGATPSEIKGFLQSADYRGMHVASQSGTCYVNVCLKSEKENTALKKIEAAVELTPITGQIYGAFKALGAVWNAFNEREVEFSITAVETEDTKCKISGTQTLLQVYYAAAVAKAFACADTTLAQKAATAGEFVANVLPAGGVVSDAIGMAATVAVPAASIAAAAANKVASAASAAANSTMGRMISGI